MAKREFNFGKVIAAVVAILIAFSAYAMPFNGESDSLDIAVVPIQNSKKVMLALDNLAAHNLKIKIKNEAGLTVYSKEFADKDAVSIKYDLSALVDGEYRLVLENDEATYKVAISVQNEQVVVDNGIKVSPKSYTLQNKNTQIVSPQTIK